MKIKVDTGTVGIQEFDSIVSQHDGECHWIKFKDSFCFVTKTSRTTKYDIYSIRYYLSDEVVKTLFVHLTLNE